MTKKIIIWDFSWIQNYLFDIKKNKSATKRLKWRSVFIEMLLEKIKEELKNEEIGKFEDKDYLVSWWKFILICDDFDKDKFDKFDKFHIIFNIFLYSQCGETLFAKNFLSFWLSLNCCWFSFDSEFHIFSAIEEHNQAHIVSVIL